MSEPPSPRVPGLLRSEPALWVGWVTTVVFFTVGGGWLSDLSSGLRFGLLFGWLFAVLLWLAFSVVRHADCLAVLLGEPYGTLVLTLAAIGIEVSMIAAVMLTGDRNATLARDAMFAVLMIVLNGILGVTLLIGGFRHHEQVYNLRGASAYLGVIVPSPGSAWCCPASPCRRRAGRPRRCWRSSWS